MRLHREPMLREISTRALLLAFVRYVTPPEEEILAPVPKTERNNQ